LRGASAGAAVAAVAVVPGQRGAGVEPQLDPRQHDQSQRRDQRPEPRAVPLRRGLRRRHDRAAGPGTDAAGAGRADLDPRAWTRRPARGGGPLAHRRPAADRLPRAPARQWDSPTVVSLADAIPTEAEALIAWKAATIELPPSNSGAAPGL